MRSKQEIMQLRQLAVGGFDHNFSYLIYDGTSGAAIDPAGSPKLLHDAIADAGIKHLNHILLTHGHPDHCDALKELKTEFPDAEICGHPGNAVAERHLGDGERIQFGDCMIETIFTPGHSRDSVSYLVNGEALLTGDTLFVDYVGFATRPDGLFASLKRISKLSGKIVIYPGHDYGSVPFRTLAEEKRLNPYLSCRDLNAFKNQLKDLI